MNLLALFRRRPRETHTASTAKQRLQVLVTLDRTTGSGPDFLPLMQKELLEVIRKYVDIDERRLKVEFERETDMSMLAVSIELPNRAVERVI